MSKTTPTISGRHDKKMLIEQPTWILGSLMPGAIFRRKIEGTKTVYLTFDDGPVPGVTDDVLDILDCFGIKATFFMVGDNVRKHPHLYQEVIRRGHKVGNHTMHHLSGFKTSTKRYLADIEEGCQYIDSQLMRPPHGWMRFPQYRALRKTGWKVIMYDVVTRDYSRHISAKRVVGNVQRYVRNGSLIVFHDSERSAEKIQEALPKAIEWLIREGYTFATL